MDISLLPAIMTRNYYVVIPFMVAWYVSGTTDISRVRTRAYQAGVYASARLQIVPGWDTIIEPMLISQLARIFVCMHGLTQGLTSDNSNRVQIDKAMIEMNQTISTELQTRSVSETHKK